jgi:hypothetical protein
MQGYREGKQLLDAFFAEAVSNVYSIASRTRWLLQQNIGHRDALAT